MLERTTHMKDKMLTYIGFAKKAGKLVAGSNACRFAMKKGRLKLLIIAEDASENTKNKMAGEAGSQGLPFTPYTSISGIGKKSSCVNSETRNICTKP